MKIILSKKLIKENHAIKKLSKYVAVFDYIDKILVVLNAKTGEDLFVRLQALLVNQLELEAQVLLFFLLTTEITKKLLNIARKKKKKHDKILILAKSKLNIIETLISQDQLTWK